MSDRRWTWSDNSEDPTGFMPYQSTSDWLSEIMKTVIDDSCVRQVLSVGADIDVAVALREKALRPNALMPANLVPGPVKPTLLSGLLSLADARQRLLAPGDANRNSVNESIDQLSEAVRQSLLAYAAIELLQSKVMSPVRSLDVLTRPEDAMPSPVILKLALARAHIEELERENKEHKFAQPIWDAVTHAWEREMAHAEATAKRWSDLVVQGRMAMGATEAVFL